MNHSVRSITLMLDGSGLDGSTRIDGNEIFGITDRAVADDIVSTWTIFHEQFAYIVLHHLNHPLENE